MLAPQRKTVFALLAVLLGGATAKATPQGDLNVVQTLTYLDQVGAYYQQLPNYRAKFRYTARRPGEEKPSDTFMGTITVQGNQYRLEIPGQTTYVDGTTVWVHVKEAGNKEEVNISDYSPAEEELNFSQIYTLHKEGYTPVDHQTITQGKHRYEVIELEPIDSEDNEGETTALYKHVKLTISQATQRITQWAVTLDDGTEEVYDIKKFKSKIDIRVGYFQFDMAAHKGIEIIDLTEDGRYTSPTAAEGEAAAVPTPAIADDHAISTTTN